jgi:hypothetical protein
VKICILSDSHDNRILLAAAVEEARALGGRGVILVQYPGSHEIREG